jgi:hypothetical protein
VVLHEVPAPLLVLCLFAETGVETILNQAFLGVAVETHRGTHWLLRKHLSLLPASEGRRFVFHHLLFDALDQAPAVLVAVFLDLIRLESLLGRQEGRLVEVALFQLPCHFLVSGESGSYVLLVDVIASKLDIFLQFVWLKAFASRSEYRALMFAKHGSSRLEFLFSFELLLSVVFSCFEVGVALLCLVVLPPLGKARLVRAEGLVELLGRRARTHHRSWDAIAARPGIVAVVGRNVGVPILLLTPLK